MKAWNVAGPRWKGARWKDASIGIAAFNRRAPTVKELIHKQHGNGTKCPFGMGLATFTFPPCLFGKIARLSAGSRRDVGGRGATRAAGTGIPSGWKEAG
jgi:hypothetical protein